MTWVAEAAVLLTAAFVVCTVAFLLLLRRAPVFRPSRPIKCKVPGCVRPWNRGRLLLCEAHEDTYLDIAQAHREDS